MGAEIGGGFLGMLVGGAATGLVSWGIAIAIPLYENSAFGRAGVAGLGAVVGSLPFTGIGAGLAGNWTGGRGRVGFAILGSSIGGIVGAGASIAGEAVVPGGSLVAAIFLFPATTITGGVLGYRLSAQSKPNDEKSVRLQPYVVPNLHRGGSRAGISIQF